MEVRTKKTKWQKVKDSEGNELFINPKPVYNEKEGLERLSRVDYREDIIEEKAQERMYSYLKSNGLRLTSERKDVLTFIYDNYTPGSLFTVRELHEKFIKSRYQIVIATVFLIINLFIKIELVVRDEKQRGKYKLC